MKKLNIMYHLVPLVLSSQYIEMLVRVQLKSLKVGEKKFDLT